MLKHLCLTVFLWLAGLAIAAAGETECRAEIKAAVAGMFQHGPFEMTSTLTGMLGEATTVAQLVPGIGLHTLTSMDGGSTEMIIVGDRLWRRYAGTEWQEAPMDENLFAAAMQPAFFDMLDMMERPRCDGEVTLDGARYRGFGFGADDKDITVDVYLWFEAETGRLMRSEGSTNIAGDLSANVTLFRYDPSITIAPPIP